MKKHLSLLMLIAALVVPWASRAQVTLPYSTGFETGDDVNWTLVNDATNVWYVGSAAHNTGSAGLYITNNGGSSNAYTNSSIQFSYAYRDFTVTTAGQVEIAFDWKANGEGNYDYLRAWIAPTTTTVTLTAAHDPEGGTSAYNYRESTPTGWIDLGGKMNLQTSWQTTVSTANLAAGNYRLVFMWANDGSGGTTPPAAIDNVSINMLTCPMPSNIEVASLTAYDATISWQYPANTANSITFYYSTSPTFTLDTCLSETVYDTSVTLTNLSPMTTYYYVIQADCGGGDSSRVTAVKNFTTLRDCGQGNTNLVDAVSYGTSSAYTQFAYNYNSSSYTVGHAGIIFTAEEMMAMGLEGPGTINSIKFRAGSTATTVPLRIYIGKTALTEFGSSATDTVGMVSHMTMVFNGTLHTTANEWVTIPFATPVPYTPDSSLIVYIYRTALPTGNGTFYYTSTSSTYRAFYGYNSSSTGRPSYTRTYNRTDIEFDICYEVPTCPRPSNLTLEDVDPNSLTLSWVDNTEGNYSSYVVEYRVAGTTQWSSVEVSDTTATLTGLSSAHQYDVRVRAYCGGTDTSMAILGTYFTPCTDLTLADLPYMQNFDGVTGATSTSVAVNNLPPCWNNYNVGTSTSYSGYPMVYNSSSYARSGSQAMRFYTTTTAGTYADQYAILPPIDSTSAPLNTLQMEFWIRSTSTSYQSFVYVGVMTNPTNPSSFVPVDTIQTNASTTYAYHEVSFANYAGPHGRIAIVAPQPASSYNALLIDDLTVREIPTCFWPTAVTAESVSQDGATLVWTPDSRTSSPNGWVVEYGPHGFIRGNGTETTVYDTTITLTGLDPNTQYDVYISADCGGVVSDPALFTFRTACGDLTVLPFTENFDGVTGATSTSVAVNNLPPCWNYHNEGTSTSYSGYPIVYNSSSYAHSGSQAMRFYTYTTTPDYDDQVAILPRTDSTLYPIHNLQLDFWLRANSTSYNSWVVVGVMTNPADRNSFVPVQTVYTNSSTTYAYHEVSFASYNGPHGCIAIKAPKPTSGYNYSYVDDIMLETLPTCPGITDLDVVATVGAALITWDHQAGYGDPANGYQVTYDSIGGTNPTVVLTTESNAMLTGLQPRTTYKAYVQADCGNDGLGRRDSITFTTASFGCAVPDPAATSTITIGSGTTTTYYVPIGNFYNYSYTQQLITADELNGPTTISAIEFQYAYSSATTVKNNVTIYLANVSATSLESAFVPYNASTFVQVYTGNMNSTNGWNTYTFTTPFQYDGTSNLLIVVHDNSGAYPGSSYTYYGHAATGKARYIQNDSSPYSISSPGAGTSYGTRANMKLHTFGCLAYATCAAPAATVTYVGTDTVELAWIPGYNETQWNVDYRLHGTTTWTNAATGVTTTNYTFAEMLPGTDYDFRVWFECDDAASTVYSGMVSARTHCAAVSIPYSYNFDDLPTGSSSARPDIPCWHHLNNGTSYFGYPYVTSTAHSGTRSLYWYSTTTTGSYGDYQVVVLPPMDTTTTPISGMQLSFWARPSSTSYAPVFYVGVMTDPENINTFQTVATVNVPSGSIDWTFHEAPLNSYHGNGNYIAVRVNRPSSSWYAYTDDFMVDVIPTCPHVRDLRVSNATENSVTIAWTPVGEETEWSITDGAGFYVTTLDTFYTITGLYGNTAYNFEVRALCSSTDSSIAMSVLARTTCPQHITLPYLEDFETYGTGTTAFPSCWHKLGSTADRPYVNATTSYGHNNTHGLYFYAASGGYCYGILPPVEPTLLTTLEVNFWARQYSTSYNCDFVVGVMTDPLDATTFVAVDTVHPAGTTYEEFTVSLANYTGTGTYIAFSSIQHPGTSTAIYMMLDDVEVYQSTNCPSVEGLYAPTVSNNNATVAWTVDGNAGHTGVMLYIATVNNIDAATDSAFVPAGTNSYTFTGLYGTTTYYVWARTECATESARVRTMNFTTTADCVPVSNVTVAGLDYTAFGLRWDAPTAGNAATAYRVYWKATTATTWDSMVVTTPYCYISGLTVNTNYQYRILTMCNDQISEANSGTIATPMCGTMVTEGGASNSYLPTYVYYNYSYTQQIYLAEELGDIDTIGAITYYYQGTLTMPRSMTIYMANTNVSSFGSSADYVPASALTQVFNGTMSGTGGWITFTLTTPFVRTPGSNLVIACNDLTGDYETSASWNATATSTTRSLYYYWDDDPFSPAAPDADASNAVLSYVNQIVLTKPNCSIPTCGTPIIFVDSTTTTAAYISWSMETGHTYEVAYRATGDTSWTVVATANTTGSYAITGLTPSSEWDVRVSTVCDGATLTGTATVQTLCAPMPLPLTEDFEDRANGVFERHCWTVGTTNLGTTYPMPIVTRLQGSEDRICLIYNGGYVILPEVAEELDSLQIRFKLTQGGENVRFLMGLMLDPAAPINSIHVLDTLIRTRIDSVNSEVNITYQFAGNVPAGYEHAHIAFWDAFNDNYSFLNDIVVEYVPHCTPASDFNVDTVTTTTATISWTNPGTNATSYVVEYGPRYYTPGNGTRVTGTGSPITLTGLDHSTSYDAYVYTVCGASGDTSVASQAIRFTTACAEITTLPYVMSFENGIVPPGSNPTDALPNCWTASGSPLPHVIYTSTGAYTGTASHCFQFNTAGGVAALPQMQPAINTLMMSFRAHNASPANAGLVIGTLNSANTFVPYDTVDFVDGTNNVYNVVCYFNDYAGNDNRIAMRSLCSSTSNYIYIDDIVVDTLPVCIPIQHLHAELLQGTSAYLVWSRSTAASYTVRYKQHSASTYTTTTTTTRDITLLGLTPQTQYDVMVIGSCNDTATLSFTTPCNAVTLPYTENFDSVSTNTSTSGNYGVMPNCWDYTLTGTSSYTTGSYLPGVYYGTTYAHSGSYSLRIAGVGYFMLPPMPVDLDTLELKLWHYTASVNYAFEVGVMEGNTFIPVQTITSPTSTKTQHTVYFATYHGNSRTIAIRNFYNSSTTTYDYSYNYLDDIQVDFIPSCMPVFDVHSVSSGTTSIDVDWTDVGTPASQWEVNYGPVGHAAGSGQTITVSSHPVTITGLSQMTRYDVYVRALCSATDQSIWSEKVTMNTNVCDGATEFYTGASTGTNNQGPVNNFYRHTLTQTIIDSAELAQSGMGEISAIAYSYSYATATTKKTNVNIWLQPTTKTQFSSESDAVAINPATAVKVYHGALNCTQGWNYFGFDTTYSWDGHSNLLVIVQDNSGDYDGSAYVFDITSHTNYKYIVYYRDGTAGTDTISAYNPSSFTASTKYRYQRRPTMKLVSCGSACQAPGVTVSDITYQSATVTAVGTGLAYELAYGTDPDQLGAPQTNTTGVFNLTGLSNNTEYFYAVRKQCDDGNWSSAATGNFTTVDLPCTAPSNLSTTNVTYTGATLTWTPGNRQTTWEVHLFAGSTVNRYDTVTNPTFTYTDLVEGTTYNMAVRGFCTETEYSDWSDTLEVTTLSCEQVTDITVSNITATGATLSWPATGAESYTVEYGYQGMSQGDGTSVTVNTNTCVLTGLDRNTHYDAYVRGNCSGAAGVWSAVVSFTTTSGGQGILDADGEQAVVVYPNPASELVTITAPAASTVTLVDLNGRQSGSWYTEDGSLTIDVSDLAKGAYFVRVTTAEGTAVRKLIVK